MECRKTENIQRQSEAAPGFWKKRAKKERREKESQVEKKGAWICLAIVTGPLDDT